MGTPSASAVWAAAATCPSLTLMSSGTVGRVDACSPIAATSSAVVSKLEKESDTPKWSAARSAKALTPVVGWNQKLSEIVSARKNDTDGTTAFVRQPVMHR